MSDSVRPHGRQPTRLLRPWGSPGKSTGVGCHCLLQCMQVKSESEGAQSCPTLSDSMDCSLPRLLHPCYCPGKSTGVGCHRPIHIMKGYLPYSKSTDLNVNHILKTSRATSQVVFQPKTANS